MREATHPKDVHGKELKVEETILNDVALVLPDGHCVVFSPEQALHLARTLRKKAVEIRPEFASLYGF